MQRTASFRTEAEGARQDVERLTGEVKNTAASLALLQREARAAGAGVDAGLTSKIRETKASLKELSADLRGAKADYKVLSDAEGPDLSKAQKSAEALAAASAKAKTGFAALAASPATAEEAPKLAMPSRGGGPRAEVRYENGPSDEASGGMSRNDRMQAQAAAHHAINATMAGQDPMDAVIAQAPDFIESLGAKFAAIAAPLALAAGGAKFISFLQGAKKEAEDLRKETAAIGSNLGSLKGQNADSLGERLTAAIEQVKKVQTVNDSVKNWFVNALTGRGVHDRDVEDAQRKQQTIQERLQDVRAGDADQDRQEFEGDGTAVERAKILSEYDQKHDEIEAQVTAGELSADTRELEIAAKVRDLKLDTLSRTAAAKQAELDLEEQLLAVRKYGKNVETDTAAAQLAKARRDLANGPQRGPQFQANTIAVRRAEIEAEEARQNQQDSLDDAALRKRNAELRGPADAVAYQQAVNNRDAIQAKLDDSATKADDRPKLEADLAEAKAQLHQIKLGDDDRAHEVVRLNIATEKGRGTGEEVRAIDRELEEIERVRRAKERSQSLDASASARLDADVAELKRKKEDILFTEKQSLDALDRQGAAIRSQGYDLDANGKKRALADKYAPEIEQAVRDNDDGKVQRLQSNLIGEQFATDVDEELMTPAEKAERGRQKLRRDQAAERVRNRQRRHAEVQAANGHSPTMDDLANHLAPHVLVSATQPNRRAGDTAQPNRRADAAAYTPKTATGQDFKGALGGVETLLGRIETKLDFKEQ